MIYMEMGQHNDIEHPHSMPEKVPKNGAAARVAVVFESIDRIVRLSAIDQQGENPFRSAQFFDQYRIAVSDVMNVILSILLPRSLDDVARGTIKYKICA